MNITHPQLVAALVKPPLDIMNTLSQDTTDLWHGATGIAGEGGELLDAILSAGSGREVSMENLVEELGDIEFYMQQVRSRAGITRDDTADLEGNIPVGLPALIIAAQIAVWSCNILDIVKKAAVYNKPLDILLLKQQLFTLDTWMAAIRGVFDVSRAATLQANIDKLKKRYEGLTYTDAAAQNRADKVEPQRKFFKGEPDTYNETIVLEHYHRTGEVLPGWEVHRSPMVEGGAITAHKLEPRTADMDAVVTAEKLS